MDSPARASAKKDAEPRVPGRLEAEAVAVTLLALAGFVELALLSYDPADPAWGFGETVANRCGPVGAFVAAGLAGTLGWAGHMLPLTHAKEVNQDIAGHLRRNWGPAEKIAA